MDGDAGETNFRGKYLGKVLPTFTVDEKRTLEKIFGENDGGNPINKEKLLQFALHCAVPAWGRMKVWKVILEVEPWYQRNLDTVWAERVFTFKTYKENLTAFRRVSEKDPMSKAFALFHMCHHKEMSLDFSERLATPKYKNIMAIAESMLKLVTDETSAATKTEAAAAAENAEPPAFSRVDVTAFWLSSRLYKVLNEVHSKDVQRQNVQCFHKRFAGSAVTADVQRHLHQIGLQEDDLPVSTWFSRGFAGILHENALAKIWDKVIGGSLKVLVYVGLELMDRSRIALLQCATPEEAIRCLSSASEETDELIASKAVGAWEGDGRQLLPERRARGAADRFDPGDTSFPLSDQPESVAPPGVGVKRFPPGTFLPPRRDERGRVVLDHALFIEGCKTHPLCKGKCLPVIPVPPEDDPELLRQQFEEKFGVYDGRDRK